MTGAEFDKIYLAWRKGTDPRRYIVGLLARQPDNQPTFRYSPEAKQLFLEEGFRFILNSRPLIKCTTKMW